MGVVVQREAFDPGAELSCFTHSLRGAGAVVSFTGLVRDTEASDLRMLVIEHYPAMTLPAIREIEAEAVRRWNLAASHVLHRYGEMTPAEPIMMVATAAAHRGEAFSAAEFLMDYLKSRAPFWKKEITGSGESWVAATARDEDALSRW